MGNWTIRREFDEECHLSIDYESEDGLGSRPPCDKDWPHIAALAAQHVSSPPAAGQAAIGYIEADASERYGAAWVTRIYSHSAATHTVPVYSMPQPCPKCSGCEVADAAVDRLTKRVDEASKQTDAAERSLAEVQAELAEAHKALEAHQKFVSLYDAVSASEWVSGGPVRDRLITARSSLPDSQSPAATPRPGYFVCVGCKRETPNSDGAADDMPEHCAKCWASARAATPAKTCGECIYLRASGPCARSASIRYGIEQTQESAACPSFDPKPSPAKTCETCRAQDEPEGCKGLESKACWAERKPSPAKTCETCGHSTTWQGGLCCGRAPDGCRGDPALPHWTPKPSPAKTCECPADACYHPKPSPGDGVGEATPVSIYDAAFACSKLHSHAVEAVWAHAQNEARVELERMRSEPTPADGVGEVKHTLHSEALRILGGLAEFGEDSEFCAEMVRQARNWIEWEHAHKVIDQSNPLPAAVERVIEAAKAWKEAVDVAGLHHVPDRFVAELQAAVRALSQPGEQRSVRGWARISHLQAGIETTIYMVPGGDVDPVTVSWQQPSAKEGGSHE